MKEKNIIRTITNRILNWFRKKKIPKKIIGYYYTICHYIIIYFSGFIMLLDNNPIHLIILLIIVSLDAFANVVCHNCPLTALEQKYLGKSLTRDRQKKLRRAGILYHSKEVYESQLELLINVWTMITCKIVSILVFRFIANNISTL